MVVPALICSAGLLVLLAVLTVAERAYLRAHATGTARDLAAAGVQARASGGPPERDETAALLAETLAQDIFHDPAPQARGLLSRRRATRSVPLSAARRRGMGTTSTRHGRGAAR